MLRKWQNSSITIIFNRISRYHGTVHLNDDSKSQRRALNAWHMILNLVHVRGGQTVCDDKSHILYVRRGQSTR